MPSWPANIAAYCALSDSDNALNFSRNSCKVCDSGLTDPSAFVMLIFNSSIASAACPTGCVRFVSRLRKLIPACDALIPLLAINPIATAVSSMLYPREPATGATYLNVSPILATSVFVALAAIAITSANLPLSFAAMPKAVSASVTISDVVPRSSPDAAARAIKPSIPSIISFASHPACAMYLNASADSDAVNFVMAPIWFAFSVNCANSSLVAPDIAFTSDIAASKSA